MKAWIELPGKDAPGFSPPDEEALLAVLAQHEIEITDDVRERVAQFARLIVGGGRVREIPERFLIAVGKPPVEATDGDFEWDEIFKRRVQDWRGNAPVDYYVMNTILTVEPDTVVGHMRPPKPGQDGRNVFGRDVSPNRRVGLPLKLSNGLQLKSDDSKQVVTTVAGRLVRQRETLRVNEVLDIRGDVDFRSGNVDSVIDVHVAGDIKPRFAVDTVKSLTVYGSIEAARVNVGGDVQVRGGLFGQESGCQIESGGDVVAGICDGAEVVAQGDIRVPREVINSKLRAGGQLLIENGSIIGGEAYARNGLKAKQAGSAAGVVTRIAVGVDGAVLYRARKIDERIAKRKQQASRLHAQVKAMLANPARVTSAQREQAAELVAKIKEVGRAASELATQRDQLVEEGSPANPATIELETMLNVGVVLVFGLKEARIEAPVKGPLLIEERPHGRSTQIVIVHRSTGTVTPLIADAVNTDRFEQDD
jgi:uncharacterized protein (DUF342 family)